jgi:hypothetical protein
MKWAISRMGCNIYTTFRHLALLSFQTIGCHHTVRCLLFYFSFWDHWRRLGLFKILC